MSDWIYNKELDLSKFYGFVYKISLPDGRFYIGQKKLKNDNKRIVGKRELEEKGKSKFRKYKSKTGKTKGQWIYYEERTKENWKEYYGSSKADDIQEFIKKHGKEAVKREIIGFAKTKKDLTYWELYYLIINNVLFNKKSINGNILGKFFKEKINKLEE